MGRSNQIAAQTRKIYRQQAMAFDTLRRRDGIETPWLNRFASRIPEGGTILDLGCGSGEPISRFLIEAGYSLTGIDTSPELLDMARARFPTAHWIEQDLRELDLGAIQFDGIISWGTVFHLTQVDQRALIAVMGTYLSPGASLLMTVGDHAGEGEGFIGDTAVYHASLSVDDYRRCLADAGLAVLDYVTRDPKCGNATVILAEKPSPNR